MSAPTPPRGSCAEARLQAYRATAALEKHRAWLSTTPRWRDWYAYYRYQLGCGQPLAVVYACRARLHAWHQPLRLRPPQLGGHHHTTTLDGSLAHWPAPYTLHQLGYPLPVWLRPVQ